MKALWLSTCGVCCWSVAHAFQPPIVPKRYTESRVLSTYATRSDVQPLAAGRRYEAGEQGLSRAAAISTVAFLLSSLPLTSIATAAEAPQVTDKVYFDVEIGGNAVGRLVFGLYGTEAPVTVSNFLKVLEGKAQGASYTYSTVFRMDKEKCIDLGRVSGGGGKKIEKKINQSGYMRISQGNAAAWTANDDINGLKHDQPFLCSMQKGGGTYEFSVTLRPNKELDKANIVFGTLLEGKDVIDEILKVRISQEDPVGSKGTFLALGQAGKDPRAKIQFLGKPLQRIVVKEAGRVS